MISFSLTPRDFTQSVFSNKNGQWATSTYLGRDVFGPVSTDFPQGYIYVINPSSNQHCPPLTNQTAASPVVSRFRVMLGFQTLALADGDALTVASWYISAPGGANQVMADLQIVRSGATYSLRLKHHTYGYSTLATGIVPGAWHVVGADLYKDRARPFANGAYLADVMGGSEYADRAYSLNFFGSAKFQPWFANAFIYHGHDGTGSSLVTVNDIPADGEAIFVKKSYLQAGIAGGNVVKSAITAGVIASTPGADGQWVRALHLGANTYGGSKKVNRSGGSWTDENFEI